MFFQISKIFIGGKPFLSFCILLCLVNNLFGSSTLRVFWGTHAGEDASSSTYSLIPNSETLPSSPYQLLQKLNAAGALDTSIDGGLIELGFFDTDGVNDSSYTPNTDISNPFSGVWTPITSETTLGTDMGTGTTSWGASRVVPAGEFYFVTDFTSSTQPTDLTISQSITNANDYGNDSSITDDDLSAAALEARMEALHTSSAATSGYTNNPLIGIRFHDTAPNSGSPGNGSKYNTLINTDWRWNDFPTEGTNFPEQYFTLYGSDGNLDSTNLFEFDNSIGNTKGSKVGNANTQVTNDNYAATITYYDGSSGGDVSGTSDIFSGLRGSGTIGLGDGRTYTLNALSGVSSVFSGNIEKQGGGSANAVIVKSGTGTQELTGELEAEGTTSGLLIYDGTLKLNPSTTNTQIVEYFGTVSGGTPVLELDNTSVGGDEIVEIGLANSTPAQEYSGAITLSGSNGTVNKITVGSADQYDKEQILSGVITGSNDLSKDGTARLRITGDSTSTFSGDIIVNDGTLVIGDGSSNGTNIDSDNAITINKGKLEIATNESVSVTVSGGTGKSIIGGAGTISAVTIGSADGEIDYISPGRGISSSLSPSKKQVNFDANESTSIGDFTVTTLNWNARGVYDWQIKDFDPTGTAGTDWDLLSFGTLNFEAGQTFDINLMAISSSNGSQGAPDNLGNTWSGNYSTSNGFLFMSGTTVNNMGSGDVTNSFNIRTEDFSYSANNWMGNWGVWHDGSGDFYLTYSAVPEPSTYIMVTGLLMVPGMSYVRRFRKKKNGEIEQVDKEIS